MKVGMNQKDLRMKEVYNILKKEYDVDNITLGYYDVIVLGINEKMNLIPYYEINPNLLVIEGYAKNKEVKEVNAVCSAYGVLHYLIEHTKKTIDQYTYTIIGYGACGQAMANLFQKLEITYEIIRHHEVNEKIVNGDIMIYTANKQVFSKEQIDRMKDKMIIDLSGTYYNNSIYLEKIPSKIAYQTSAIAISKYIKEKINEKENTLWN